jgi:FAD/FMN-containing dehydrogenase
MLQGQHGLLADQLLEARLVLADGSAITVSETENKDLFWGIRGAGHNFGVLTSAKLKVYDQPARNWTYQSIIYPGAMAEKVFQASNELNANMPAELTNFILMRKIPQINPNKVSFPVHVHHTWIVWLPQPY